MMGLMESNYNIWHIYITMLVRMGKIRQSGNEICVKTRNFYDVYQIDKLNGTFEYKNTHMGFWDKW